MKKRPKKKAAPKKGKTVEEEEESAPSNPFEELHKAMLDRKLLETFLCHS